MPRSRNLLLLALTASLSFVLVVAPVAAAADPRVLPPDARAHGKSLAEWAAEWWQWALGQPVATNPLVDQTGAQCANDQSGKVWFLAGTTGGSVDRTCAVPTGTALFFPIVNVVTCAFPTDPPEQQTEAFLRGQVNPLAQGATNLSLTIDGVAVEDVERFYTESALFGMVLGPDNLFGLPAGQVIDPCADAGYYVMLPPLPPGEHTIEFGGSLPGFPAINVTYTLTVG